ncbi:MAG: hypothetical protein HOQ34_07465 [Gemmatimonadaceae bacterium]|nr:hypothetical protein [Gemmatimonadaceae bacterium]
MAPSIPTREPKTLVAGDRWQWSRTLADYSASAGDVLSYDLVGATGDVLSIDGASVTGSGSTWTIDYTSSSGLPGGTYAWAARITNSGKRTTVDRGTLTIEADAVAIGTDEADLAAIDAVISKRITADVEAYTIGGRAVTKIPTKDLLVLRGIIASRVWRKRNPTQAFPQKAAVFDVR